MTAALWHCGSYAVNYNKQGHAAHEINILRLTPGPPSRKPFIEHTAVCNVANGPILGGVVKLNAIALFDKYAIPRQAQIVCTLGNNSRKFDELMTLLRRA